MAQRDPTKGTPARGHTKSDQSGSFDPQVDEFLDEALDETFPASDPVAVTPPPRRRRSDPDHRHA